MAQHLRLVTAGDEQEKKWPLPSFDTFNGALTFTNTVSSRGNHFHFCAIFPSFLYTTVGTSRISRRVGYICSTVHTVLVIVNSRRFLCRA